MRTTLGKWIMVLGLCAAVFGTFMLAFTKDAAIKTERDNNYLECITKTPDVEWCLKVIYGVKTPEK